MNTSIPFDQLTLEEQQAQYRRACKTWERTRQREERQMLHVHNQTNRIMGDFETWANWYRGKVRS
jgi:hypothetical protein